MKRTLAWLLTLLMLLSSVSLAQAAPEDPLIVGATTAMTGSFMNGMFGSNTADIDVRRLLHGHSLIHWDAEAGAYIYDRTVVTGYRSESVPGGTRYTLRLSDKLRYSDGTPITAADYAFSLLLTLSPEARTLGASASSADHILGSAEYAAGQADTLRGVQVTDEHTLVLTVQEDHTPNYYSLALLDVVPFPIQAIAPGCQVRSTNAGCLIEDIGGGDTLFTSEMLQATLLDPVTGYVTHPGVVSGPYVLTDYDAEASVAAFRRNAYYAGNADGQKPRIEQIVYRLVTNEEASDLLLSGKIDLMHKALDPRIVEDGLAHVKTGELRATAYERTGLSFISFSCERLTMESAAVRQAIAHCFDKTAFITDTLGERGVAVDGFYGVGQWMYQRTGENGLRGLKRYPLDVSAAAALLESDGWLPNSQGVREKVIGGETVVLSLTLLYPEGSEAGSFLSGKFADALAQAGIALTAEARPFADLLRIYYRQDAREADMIYLASNFGTVYDPSEMFDPAAEAQGVANRTGIRDQRLYDLAVDLRRTSPGAAGTYCAKWVALQEYWTQVLPAIPVYSNIYYDFYTPALTGYDVTETQTWSEAIVGAELR